MPEIQHLVPAGRQSGNHGKSSTRAGSSTRTSRNLAHGNSSPRHLKTGTMSRSFTFDNRRAGQKAYVMKIKLDDVNPLLYVKLQLGAGKVIGRSFHYSKLDQEGE